MNSLEEISQALKGGLSRRKALQQLGGLMTAAVVVPGLFGKRASANTIRTSPSNGGTFTSNPAVDGPLRESGSPRFQHTATPLLDGRVLLAGGLSANPLSSAEIFDPMRGVWQDAVSMSTPRALHAAALLPDGRVLVAGGLHRESALSTVEIYDPRINAWMAAPNMPGPRFHHTAVALPGGQVLVSGGYNHQPLSSAVLYDPANERWTTL